jgi:predicted Zn-dependent peptidase
VAELSRLTVEELKRSAEDMTEAEVARARAQLKAGMVMGLESPSARAERIARMVAIWGRVPTLEEAVAKVDAVDLSTVRDFAGALATAGVALALYGPVEAAPDLAAIRGGLAA